ncbi:MAG: UvrD-helicase domain-containing protein [Bifidobacteriaceae bacterium]|jgi:DNA helicase-2/ATP-dependent DNA helicase PcrA|nr:UvrD-helicase domain-containing protein [Bifidobacteriaceae bacterium]
MTLESASNQALEPPLNPQQKEAVEYDGSSLLVLAGAGSGKTRVITYRIANILKNTNIAPWEILAITFTNKAADELKYRLHKLVGERARSIWAYTFHAACLRILRKEHNKAGLPSNFVIYDTQDSKQLIKMILSDLNIDPKKYSPNSFRNEISNLKSELLSPAESIDEYDDFEKHLFDVFRVYNSRLKKANALDFDDIILRTIYLLDNSAEVRAEYQNQFKYIFVDEYQDTNVAQYQLVKRLFGSGNSLTVVGDVDQSIYSFRGADIRNIVEFEKDWEDAKVIVLDQNYRSTNTILQAANNIIDPITNKYKKNLWSALGDGEKIVVCETDNEIAESEYIVDKIRELIDFAGYKEKDIAVFYRTNAMSRAIEEQLLLSSTPYKVIGGTKFYDRKEIRDALAYLKVISNPDDDVNLLRIINFPARGLGKVSVEKVLDFARGASLSLYAALNKVDQIQTLSNATKRRFQDFVQIISFLSIEAADIKNLETETDIVSFTNNVVDKTGLKSHFEESADPQDQVRLENLDQLVNIARTWKEGEADANLENFLEMISLISDTDDLADLNAESGFVSLMTLHSAKGLEFPVVFFTGLEDGTVPSSLSVGSSAQMDEERRLAYVGVTRAKERLYLTWSTSRLQWGRVVYLNRSPYLLDIGEELITETEYKNYKFAKKNNYSDKSFKSKYGFFKY